MGTVEPLTLISQILEDAELYDKENATCDGNYQKARDHAEAAVNFLWLIHLGEWAPGLAKTPPHGALGRQRGFNGV